MKFLLPRKPLMVTPDQQLSTNTPRRIAIKSVQQKISGNIRLCTSLLLFCCFAPFSTAQAVPIVVTLEDVTNQGAFFANLEISDTASNAVKVALDISSSVNTGLNKGDILGFFFDVTAGFDPTTLVTSNFIPSGNGITGNVTVLTSPSSPGGGSTLGGQNNLNGTKFLFDVGIETGKNGSAQGFNQMIMFDLMGTGLSTASFGTDFGLRVQSINGATLFAGGSSKLIGSSAPTATVPTPGTFALLFSGLIGITFARRLTRRRLA